MKQNNITGNNYSWLWAACGSLFVVVIFLVSACNRTLDASYQVQDRKVLMFDQLKSDTSMSIVVQALERANLAGALNSYGPYTFFAPDNNAFRKYFQNQGKTGLDGFSDSTLRTIMIYHILPTRLKAEEFIQGPQTTATGAGDYISIDISKGYKSTAIANGIANIYQTNLEYYNGYVHKMDAVLDPPVLTIGEFLKNNPDKYSIFTAGLQKAGLMDTLSSLTNSSGIRIRLTLFCETNDVLQKAGISTFDNLSMDSLVKLMRDHLVPGSNFSSSYTHHTTALPSIGLIDRWDSTVLSLDGQDWIYFNLSAPHLIDSTTDLAASDIIMRNGIMHNVSVPLSFPATKKRTQIYHAFWSATNYCYGIPGFTNGNSSPVANASSGNWRYYYDGTTISSDKSTVTYLLFMNPDGVNDSLVTVVKNVRKGKYSIAINAKGGARGTFQLYCGNDTIGTAVNYSFPGLATYRQNYVIGTYDFKTSGDQRLKFACTVVGGLNLECMVLTPVY
jgi:uncharacterized surface protein with fasciclin (FAS1) repeats